MLRFSLDAISSFSHRPLQLATLLGFLISPLAFVAIPVVIVLRILGSYLPGFGAITIAVLLLGGIQLIAIGIIGEYVGRIYDEVKGRPLYLVRARTQHARPRRPTPTSSPARGAAAHRSSASSARPSSRAASAAGGIRPEAGLARPPRSRLAAARGRRAGSSRPRLGRLERPLERGDAAREALDRVGDRVGQVDPVGVGALGRRPSTRTGWPGLPTTVEFGGTSWMTTLLAPIFEP